MHELMVESRWKNWVLMGQSGEVEVRSRFFCENIDEAGTLPFEFGLRRSTVDSRTRGFRDWLIEIDLGYSSARIEPGTGSKIQSFDANRP